MHAFEFHRLPGACTSVLRNGIAVPLVMAVMTFALTNMLRSPPSPPVRYGVTAAIMIAAALVEFLVQWTTGFAAYFLLLPGIFYCGILFDRGSSYLASALGTVTVALLLPDSATAIRGAPIVVLFGMTAGATSLFTEKMRETIGQVTRAERVKDMLLRELDHRTKNNMMSMASLLRLQARQVTNSEVKETLEAAAGRIGVMADIYDQLQPSSIDRCVNMRLYLAKLCETTQHWLGSRPVTIHATTDDTELPEHRALPLAIVVNELITNSLKHAFPENRAGAINVELSSNDKEVVTIVTDNGIGCAESARIGLGSKLMQVMMQQLEGTLQREPGHPGCRTTLRMAKT